MEERKKTQVADMDRGVYDIKNNFEYSYIADAGLTEDIIREIWSNKNEPEWMLDFRLKSLEIYNRMEIPNWIPDILHSFHKLYPGIVIEVLQGTYDDVVYWIKNGVVDMGFLSASSAGDLSIVPLYKDPLLCVMPQNMERHGDGEYIGIDEMKTYPFVAQRESTDADIQNFLKGSALDVHAKYHVVDDLAMVSMVAHGFGICIMPEMVMKDIPYEVKCYPIKPEAYRIVGLATQNSEFMAPAVSTMYQYIIEHYKQKDEVDV